MKSPFMKPQSLLTRLRDKDQRIDGGKLYPVMIEPFQQSEAGVISQQVEVDVDPLVGRLESKIHLHLVSVYVPLLACEEYKYPNSPTSGYAEAFRDKHIAGLVFDLEDETELSKRMSVNPRSIAGVKKVNEVNRLAHNAAYDFLARRKYIKAAQIGGDNEDVQPALLSSTALELLNGVLDPDETIHGAVDLQGDVPIAGLGYLVDDAPSMRTVKETQGSVTQNTIATGVNTDARFTLAVDSTGAFPKIHAKMSDAGGVLTLEHLHQAREDNQLIRELDRIVREHPEHGEEMVADYVYGLNMDAGNQPWVIFEREVQLNDDVRNAMDGDNLDVEQTETGVRISYQKIIPATEFGGLVVTFVAVKPDEVFAQQPDPVLSNVWGGRNFARDASTLAAERITARDLWSDVPSANEGDTMMYVGNNNLLRSFVCYGFTETVDTNQIQNKNKIWQHEIPLSLSPTSIFYPAQIDHYPWFDQVGDIAWVRTVSQVTRQSPIPMGPTPLETNEVIRDLNLIGQE